jgi:hypothetical protein
MENAGMFSVHLEYFTVIWYILWSFNNVVVIWYILWSFGNVVVIWYIFCRFGILYQEKSGNPV